MVQAPGSGRTSRNLDHLAGDVRADDRTRHTDRLRNSEGDQAGSARDVEHALTRPQASHLEHQLMGRRELGLPCRLVGGRRPIPAIALDTPLQARIHGGQTSWPLRRTARRSGVAWAKTSR